MAARNRRDRSKRGSSGGNDSRRDAQGDLLAEVDEAEPGEGGPAEDGADSEARDDAVAEDPGAGRGGEGEEPAEAEEVDEVEEPADADEAPDEEEALDEEGVHREVGGSDPAGEKPGTAGRDRVEDESGDSPDARLEKARRLVAGGLVQEAIEVYRDLVVRHPDHLRARNDLGVLFDELGQHELALEQFEAAREIDPERVEVLANAGAALAELGRFEEAERELRRAQRLDPDSIDVRAKLGVLYFRRGLYAQAETELRWVCIRDNSHGPAHFYRGEALNRLGRVDDAMEALERAASLQPNNARAFYTLGILFDKKHMPQEAERMYRRARELGRP
ncbi:MAG: tetratricopeptide repeat protein [Gemmatimonadota bacterium]|jgi:tetratricopeptide (TPR) repeat protein